MGGREFCVWTRAARSGGRPWRVHMPELPSSAEPVVVLGTQSDAHLYEPLWP